MTLRDKIYGLVKLSSMRGLWNDPTDKILQVVIDEIEREIKNWEEDGKDYKSHGGQRFTDGAIGALELLLINLKK